MWYVIYQNGEGMNRDQYFPLVMSLSGALWMSPSPVLHTVAARKVSLEAEK
jgi:hypothetical protein